MSLALEHIPADMTATLDAAWTLTAMQAELAKGGQWLPIDPPSPDTITIADLVAHNLSGPRRYGYGTIRDYVIGLKAHLADGRTIKMGGKVVKNVAGYDLQKLFIGAGNTLGKVVEATFKLRPRPEMERLVQKNCATLKDVEDSITAVLDSPITPVVFDLFDTQIVLGFDGPADDVNWQLAQARGLGFVLPATFGYEKSFWSLPPESISKLSVLPSKLTASLPSSRYVARAGNGIIYYQGAPVAAKAPIPEHLMQRAREAFA